MTKIFVACTGAGARLQGLLWDTPGASEYLVGGVFPYSRNEMDEYLGFKPEGYCSEATALHMAMTSYIRAKREGGPKEEAYGVGLCASVASVQEHRGDHRIHVAAFGSKGAFLVNKTRTKGSGAATRERDGISADEWGMIALDLVKDGETNVSEERLQDMLLQSPIFDNGRRYRSGDDPTTVLFPGSFNPFHFGHRGIIEEVECVYHYNVRLTVDLTPAHKSPPTVAQCLDKVIECGMPIEFTRGQPLFIDKARANPNTAFILGADTLERMMDPKWGVEIEPMIAELKSLGTYFYVADRGGIKAREVIGQFNGSRRFTFLTSNFDVSSTEIREKTK